MHGYGFTLASNPLSCLCLIIRKFNFQLHTCQHVFNAFSMRLYVEMVNHKLFINRMETDSFVLFYRGSFVLKYADSPNQRDFFLHDCLFYEYVEPHQ